VGNLKINFKIIIRELVLLIKVPSNYKDRLFK